MEHYFKQFNKSNVKEYKLYFLENLVYDSEKVA